MDAIARHEETIERLHVFIGTLGTVELPLPAEQCAALLFNLGLATGAAMDLIDRIKQLRTLMYANNWLIWSNQHRMWWRPSRHGYTDSVSSAGRYSLEEALEVCRSANLYLGDGTNPDELIQPSPEWIDARRELLELELKP